MDKLSILKRINMLYQNEDINISNYLKGLTNNSVNSIEDILISYDFQAGSYSEAYQKNPIQKKNQLNELLEIMKSKILECNSILEVGVGEATSMIEIIKNLEYQPENIYGFDISWSRVKYAQQMIMKYGIENASIVTADLFNMPFADNSIDLVYTVHALEPNGGREREALIELYRVSKKYIILLEPCYEISSDEEKVRMEKLGYIKNLKQTILDLGFNLIFEEVLKNNLNSMNKAKIYVITKNPEFENDSVLCCPITKSVLQEVKGSYYSKDSLLVYPIIDGVPMLLNESAVVATKFLDFK